MRRISSSLVTWWYKGVGLWFLGFAAIAAWAAVCVFIWRGQIPAPWLAAPVLLAALGWAYFRDFVFPLADEVLDDGDRLILRHGSNTKRLALRDVKSVDYSLVFDPPRIALHTMTAGKVVFMPYLTPGMCFFREHPLVAELRKRCAGSSS